MKKLKDMSVLNEGDVLWTMEGYERNDICKFYAVPKCVEYVDEHKFLFGNKCGGSLNLIGNKYFFTRQECLDDFSIKHKSFEVPISEVEDMESCIHHKERTDFQELIIVRDDTVTDSAVYIGGLCDLTNYTERLKWISEPCEPLYMDIEYLTLTQIYRQIKKMTNNAHVMITVIVNSPLHGEIYQCGNHYDGVWEKIGTTLGYA